jgi:tRNA (guanine37-N1)-methyltransferase
VQIDLLTPIPAMAEGYLAQSMMKRAREKGLVRMEVRDLRDWTTDRHRTVDDTPYGGGPGMVMKVEPIDRALRDLRTEASRVIFLSPQGTPLRQATARRLAGERHLIFLCGHYEGVDQRVCDHLVDEEISIGDYVLTNGVLPALVVIDAVVRLIPGVLGDGESAAQDSFGSNLLDHPHYTKPAEYRGWQVPPVLLSGDHGAIARWRAGEALRRTRERRPDLGAGDPAPEEI